MVLQRGRGAAGGVETGEAVVDGVRDPDAVLNFGQRPVEVILLLGHFAMAPAGGAGAMAGQEGGCGGYFCGWVTTSLWCIASGDLVQEPKALLHGLGHDIYSF